MKTALIALAMTGSVLAGAPASAEKATILYGDLDLATAKGLRALEQRIDIAARKICGFNDHITGTRVRSPETKRCYAHAKAQGLQTLAAIVSANQLGG